MDKTFAFMMIGAFAIIALWITCFTIEAGVKKHYRNTACKSAMYGFTSMLWICTIALAILTIIY